jgi:CMP-N,N'-diacetyllegionaminic acid synthase
MAHVLGAEAPFLRPAEISGDLATDYEFVSHALDWLAAQGQEPAYVVHVRPTTPFRDPALIDEAVRAFRAAVGATALRSVHEMSESAYKTFEIAQGGLLKRLGTDSLALDAANDARQQFPTTYNANGYVDVLSSAFIRDARLLHGNRVMAFVTPPVVEVDTEEDFAHLEFKLARTPAIVQRLF